MVGSFTTFKTKQKKMLYKKLRFDIEKYQII